MSEGRRLLAVDDEQDIADFIRRVAETLGYEARALTDPTRFAEVYEEFQPDVLFIDMVMPDVEGVELIQWLAKEGSTAQVFILSGFNPHYAQMAHMLGELRGLKVESHSKPISLSKLSTLLA